MTTTDYDFNYSELARQIAARISPEALLSAEDVGACLATRPDTYAKPSRLHQDFQLPYACAWTSKANAATPGGDEPTLKSGSQPILLNVGCVLVVLGQQTEMYIAELFLLDLNS